MGRKVDLSSLAGDPVLEAPVPAIRRPSPGATTVPVDQVALNPVNPREDYGDLSDLESIRTLGQLQPCVVVTQAAFLTIYPEYGDAVADAPYVVVAGSRRRAAAEKYGVPKLDVVVKDQLAATRVGFFAAAIAENVDRRNFDVLEEARAVERLVRECGTGIQAAQQLGRSEGWVSQRMTLLHLSPDMQQLLRVGELPVRRARDLARLPASEQLAAWRAEQQAHLEAKHLRQADGLTAVNQPAEAKKAEAGEAPNGANGARPRGSDSESPGERRTADPAAERAGFAAMVLKELATRPDTLAELLRRHLTDQQLQQLVALLG